MNRIQTISSALNDLRQRLEGWRRQRSGRSRIPEPFWAEALALARIEGSVVYLGYYGCHTADSKIP